MTAPGKLKSAAKRAVLASRALRLLNKPGVAVLMYHSVKECPEGARKYSWRNCLFHRDIPSTNGNAGTPLHPCRHGRRIAFCQRRKRAASSMLRRHL